MLDPDWCSVHLSFRNASIGAKIMTGGMVLQDTDRLTAKKVRKKELESIWTMPFPKRIPASKIKKVINEIKREINNS